MASIRPEDLNLSALPRSPLGHLKAEAVAELLQRAAWDYREALAQNQRLAATVEMLTQQVAELTAQVTSLEEAAARHRDPDEVARALLTAAREERESARREAELLLKKAARRAGRMEHESARDAEGRMSELARIKELREEVISQLRATLAAINSRHGGETSVGVEAEETAVRAAPEQ